MKTTTYEVPTSIPWAQIARPLERAEVALARLDERLRRSNLAEGWSERTHFADACAALWAEGELVHLEDLVLRDAMMDVRAPTAATNRALRVLRARRLAQRRGGEWALSSAGLDGLRDRRPPWSKNQHERSDLVYSADWDEDEAIETWREVTATTDELPVLVGAALAFDAWYHIRPLERDGWVGPLLVAALLQSRSKTRHHLSAINVGLRAMFYRRHRQQTLSERLAGFLGVLAAYADAGHKELDRLSLAHEMLAIKLKGRRSTSHLPQLVDLVLARPILSVALAAKELKVSTQAVEQMVRKLGCLRELTGRGRYRAWGI